MRRTDLSDRDILEALRDAWNGWSPTYVLRNVLSTGRPRLKTASILTRLKRLEREGKVQRVKRSYEVMLCWAIAEAGRASLSPKEQKGD